MKTRAEIIEAIKKKEEEKRLELVTWAIDLIEAATEEMFEKLETKTVRRVTTHEAAEFDKATSFPEVKEVLEKAEVKWSINQYAPGETFCEIIFNLY